MKTVYVKNPCKLLMPEFSGIGIHERCSPRIREHLVNVNVNTMFTFTFTIHQPDRVLPYGTLQGRVVGGWGVFLGPVCDRFGAHEGSKKVVWATTLARTYTCQRQNLAVALQQLDFRQPK